MTMVWRVDQTQCDVFKNRTIKQTGFLLDQTDVASQCTNIQGFHIVPIQQDSSFNRVIESSDQTRHSGFSTSRQSNNSSLLTSRAGEGKILEYWLVGTRRESEGNIAQFNIALDLWQDFTRIFIGSINSGRVIDIGTKFGECDRRGVEALNEGCDLAEDQGC